MGFKIGIGLGKNSTEMGEGRTHILIQLIIRDQILILVMKMLV